MKASRVEAPHRATSPTQSFDGVNEQLLAVVAADRVAMPDMVHAEVEAYLSDARLVFDREVDGFPNRARLTGTYFVGHETYSVVGEWLQVSVRCHCLGRARLPGGPDDEYLGLELWLRRRLEPAGSFYVFRNPDSTAI